jgi:hypothetical protein
MFDISENKFNYKFVRLKKEITDFKEIQLRIIYEVKKLYSVAFHSLKFHPSIKLPEMPGSSESSITSSSGLEVSMFYFLDFYLYSVK